MLCHMFYCLSAYLFSFLAMALSVYFRFMSLTVPLVYFVPLLEITGTITDTDGMIGTFHLT